MAGAESASAGARASARRRVTSCAARPFPGLRPRSGRGLAARRRRRRGAGRGVRAGPRASAGAAEKCLSAAAVVYIPSRAGAGAANGRRVGQRVIWLVGVRPLGGAGLPPLPCPSLHVLTGSCPSPRPEPALGSAEAGGAAARAGGLFPRVSCREGFGSPPDLDSHVPFRRTHGRILQWLTEADAPFRGRPGRSAALGDALSARSSRGPGPCPSRLADSLCCPAGGDSCPPRPSRGLGAEPLLWLPSAVAQQPHRNPGGLFPPAGSRAMKVKIKCWNGVATWLWVANDENCGICRMAFNGCCPDCECPCPPSSFDYLLALAGP